jgi:hypothetical protein
VAQLEPEQRRAAAVLDEVDAREVEPAERRERVARVAAAAREARRGPDPLVADAEPDAVRELVRRRPHAAHLAGDVPAVSVEAAVLEADRIRPRAGGDLAPVLQAVARGHLRRLRRRRQHRDRHGQDERAHDRPQAYPATERG